MPDEAKIWVLIVDGEPVEPVWGRNPTDAIRNTNITPDDVVDPGWGRHRQGDKPWGPLCGDWAYDPVSKNVNYQKGRLSVADAYIRGESRMQRKHTDPSKRLNIDQEQAENLTINKILSTHDEDRMQKSFGLSRQQFADKKHSLPANKRNLTNLPFHWQEHATGLDKGNIPEVRKK